MGATSPEGRRSRPRFTQTPAQMFGIVLGDAVSSETARTEEHDMARRRGNGEDSIYPHEGRWYVAGYIDEGAGRVRRRVSAKTRTEAVKKWERRKTNASKTARREGQPKNIAEMIDHWLEGRRAELKYKTLVGYESAIDRHLKPHFGTRKPTEVTVADVERWQQGLAKQGLSYSTVHQARTVLSQAFDMAIRHRDIATNPVRIARSPKKSTTRIEALSLEQAQRLVQSLPADDPQTRVRILLALTLGLRQGELLALQWQDVDLDSSTPTVAIRASLQRQTGRGLVRTTPKTAKSHRRISLSEELVQVLAELSLEHKRLKLQSGGAFNPERYVLVSSKGTPIDPANDRKHWHRLLESAGLPRVRVHASRHTAATLMLKEEGMHVVQQVLGHTSIRTTVDIYGHLTAADGAQAISGVSSKLAETG